MSSVNTVFNLISEQSFVKDLVTFNNKDEGLRAYNPNDVTHLKVRVLLGKLMTYCIGKGETLNNMSCGQ